MTARNDVPAAENKAAAVKALQESDLWLLLCARHDGETELVTTSLSGKHGDLVVLAKQAAKESGDIAEIFAVAAILSQL